MNVEEVLGKTTTHLVWVPGTKILVHKDLLESWLKLKENARLAGFNLEIASSFRSYERQELIWNSKASGQRELLYSDGQIVDFSALSAEKLMWTILRWSALPGASRHHWGTDLDIFDARTQTKEEVKLIPSECEGLGSAAKLHEWLDGEMNSNRAFGFYRPYRLDQGGIAPERWHLSFEPVAKNYEAHYTLSVFKKNIEDSSILLKEEVLANLSEIYQRVIKNVQAP